MEQELLQGHQGEQADGGAASAFKTQEEGDEAEAEGARASLNKCRKKMEKGSPIYFSEHLILCHFLS